MQQSTVFKGKRKDLPKQKKVNGKEKKIRQARKEKGVGEEDRHSKIEGNVYEYAGF